MFKQSGSLLSVFWTEASNRAAPQLKTPKQVGKQKMEKGKKQKTCLEHDLYLSFTKRHKNTLITKDSISSTRVSGQIKHHAEKLEKWWNPDLMLQNKTKKH